MKGPGQVARTAKTLADWLRTEVALIDIGVAPPEDGERPT